MCGRISVGAQGAVEAHGERLGVLTEFQNASTVWPERVRPERSVMVPEIQIGSDSSPSSSRSRIGLDRRLAVQRVGDGLDQEQVDPAVMQGQHLFAIGVVDLVEGDQRARRDR